MIIDDCEIVFQNKEISQKVTLSCPDIVSTEQICLEGNLINGICEYTICPDSYVDNGDNCKKEVPSIQQGIVLYIGRFWTGGAFGSRITVTDLSGGVGNIDSVFTNFTRTGTLSVTLAGVTYSGTLTSNIVGQNQIDYDNNSDPFASLIPNSLFTYPQQTILGDQVDSATWNGQTYTRSVNTTCPSGSTSIDGKCYELVDKITSQEVPITNSTVEKQVGKEQIVIVKKGETESNISQRHADQLAKDLLNSKVASLQPICTPTPVYYNEFLTKTGKKTCISGTPCDVTVSVEANKYSSDISIADANSKAQQELNNLFNSATPCCTPVNSNFVSEQKSFSFTKSCSTEVLTVIVNRGGNMVFRGIIIPSFDSSISVTDANNKRDLWFLNNKILFEDLIICPTVDCDDSTIIKTTIKLLLRINGVLWSLERFDNGSFIDDFNELNNEVNNIPSYKIKYCTSIPVFAGEAANPLDSTGVNIVSIDKNIINYSYIIGSPSFNDGEYQVTIKLQGNKNGASKIFKYGSDNCC